jgi:hypothetical protein
MVINFINFISFIFIFIILLIPIIIATDVFDDFSSTSSIITIIVCFLILISSGYYIFSSDISSNKTFRDYIDNNPSSISSDYQQQIPQQLLQPVPQIIQNPQQLSHQIISNPPSQQQYQQPQLQQPQQLQQNNNNSDNNYPNLSKYYGQMKELNSNIKKMLNAMEK